MSIAPLVAESALTTVFVLRLLWATRGIAPEPKQDVGWRPRCSIVRPCAGAPAWSATTLTASLSAMRDGDETLLAVESEQDPAFAIAEQVAAAGRERGADVKVVLGGRALLNRKTARLERGAEDADAEIIVVADDDVLLDARTLDALVDEVARHGGAAFCPPVEVGSDDAPARIADASSAGVLGASPHCFAVLGALQSGSTPTFVGKLFAVRRDALAAIGGFAALGEVLGEDQAMCAALVAVGAPARMLAFPARSLAHGRSYGALVARYARWLTVVRLQRPWLLPSYPLLLASLPMVAALALVALATGAPTRAVALAVASPLVARWALAFALGAKLGRGGSLARRWLEPFLADALLTVAWLRAVTRSDVQWRGRALRAEGGKLVAAEARPAD